MSNNNYEPFRSEETSWLTTIIAILIITVIAILFWYGIVLINEYEEKIEQETINQEKSFYECIVNIKQPTDNIKWCYEKFIK